MKTKCIVLGEEQERNDKYKPIDFVHVIVRFVGKVKVKDAGSKPSIYLNVELISRSNHSNIFDLMLAYNNDRRNGVTYLGHWNDGVATKEG